MGAPAQALRRLSPLTTRRPARVPRAIDMANLFDLGPHGALASEAWEFHTRAYLLVMLADFYSIVDAVAKTLDTKNIALTPSQLRKVCERAAIRALMSARESDLRADLYRSSFGHACHILENRVHTPRPSGAISH